MTKPSPLRGKTADLARLLNITQRRIFQLVDEGVIAKQPEGDFILPEAIAAYYEFKYAPDEEVDYLEEKAKHEAAKRALAELELAERRHELHRGEDVEQALTGMLSNLRAQLLGMPAKLAPLLDGAGKERVAEVLTDELETRLSELSEYGPTMFDRSKDNAAEND